MLFRNLLLVLVTVALAVLVVVWTDAVTPDAAGATLGGNDAAGVVTSP